MVNVGKAFSYFLDPLDITGSRADQKEKDARADAKVTPEELKTSHEALSGFVSDIDKSPWDVKQGVSQDYKQEISDIRSSSAADNRARMQQQSAVDMMRKRAMGQGPTIAEQQANLAAEGIRKGARSQLASGQFNPMALRSAQIGQAQALGQLGAQTGIAAGQERRADQAAYLGATGQLRGADQQQKQLRVQEALKREGLAQEMRKMGIGERVYQEGAAQELEKLKKAREMEILSATIAMETGQPFIQPNQGSSGLEKVAALAPAIAAIASDETSKMNISDISTEELRSELGSRSQGVNVQSYAPTRVASYVDRTPAATSAEPRQYQGADFHEEERASYEPVEQVIDPEDPPTGSQADAAKATSETSDKDYMDMIALGAQVLGQMTGGQDEKWVNPSPVRYQKYFDRQGVFSDETAKRNVVPANNVPMPQLEDTTSLPPVVAVPPQEQQQQQQVVDPTALVAAAANKQQAPNQVITKTVAAPPEEKKGFLGGLLGGVLSDEESKEKVEGGGGQLDEFLNAMKAKEYEYKPEYGPPGRRVGVMAQDVQDSELGEDIVFRNPESEKLMLDVSPDKFNPLVLASLARLNDRLDKLEG